MDAYIKQLINGEPVTIKADDANLLKHIYWNMLLLELRTNQTLKSSIDAMLHENRFPRISVGEALAEDALKSYISPKNYAFWVSLVGDIEQVIDPDFKSEIVERNMPGTSLIDAGFNSEILE
jgi:hypothetical protein